MKCVNCLYPKTQVVNSRARKDGLSVWRRRKCPRCAHVTTSEETTSISGIYTVSSADGTGKFETVKLVLSIYEALRAANTDGDAALPLAQTVQEHVVDAFRPAAPLRSQDIAELVYPVIKRYSALAGSIYAARHAVAESRPGRPKKR